MQKQHTSSGALLSALSDQAKGCRGLGSSFTALICEALADIVRTHSSSSLPARSGIRTLMERLETWPGNPAATHDSVPLRLAGGLHALARRGDVPALLRIYPPATMPSRTVVTETILNVFEDHAAFMNEWINSPPQTNEVGRSAVLGAGLAAVEGMKPGLDWRVLELGASGGLNLIADRYALHLSGLVLGEVHADVSLEPEWSGVPLAASSRLPHIVTRTGCDLNPLDVSRLDARERLMAYIWADQAERLEKAKAAIEIASSTAIDLHRKSADAFLERQLKRSSCPTIISHSIAWQYFPAEVKAKCRAVLREAALHATPDAPLAWLGMEADGVSGSAGLRLKIWPAPEGEGASRLLARVDYHGRWIEWLDSRSHQIKDPGGEES